MGRKLHFCALIWLLLWLALSIVRQVFDIIGKLWALVLIDMVQLIAIVSGLFALCHPSSSTMPCRNRLLLAGLALFSALSVGHNVALLLWFCTDLLVADHQQSDLLSLGLPFGHSFFLRHTPLCEAQFNSSAQHWEQQQEHCPIQYSYLEGGQAVLHTLMALGTLLLVITILFGINTDRRRHGTPGMERPSKKQQLAFAEAYTTTAGCGGGGTVDGGTVMASSTNDFSSPAAYMMDPSAAVGCRNCGFAGGTFSATGSLQAVPVVVVNGTANQQWQFAASGTIVPSSSPLTTTMMAPLTTIGGGRRSSCPRPGRRASGGTGANLQQKKSAHLRSSTTGTPTLPAVPPPAVVHERYSSLSTTGATDVVTPRHGTKHYCRSVLSSNNDNNTASPSSTSSAYGVGENFCNTMASSDSVANIDHPNHHDRYGASIDQHHDHRANSHYNHRYKQSLLSPPQFYASAGLVGDTRLAPRVIIDDERRCRASAAAVPSPAPQPLYNRRVDSSMMRTFCAAPKEPCDNATTAVAGDCAAVGGAQRQRQAFSPLGVMSSASSPLPSYSPVLFVSASPSDAPLQRGADGRRSAGAVAFRSTGTSRANCGGGGHVTSLISFDPKSNTLIRVREHRRPSSSSSSPSLPDEAGTRDTSVIGGSNVMTREHCMAATMATGSSDQRQLSSVDRGESAVLKSPAPIRPPLAGCCWTPLQPPAARHGLFQPDHHAADVVSQQEQENPRTANNAVPNWAPTAIGASGAAASASIYETYVGAATAVPLLHLRTAFPALIGQQPSATATTVAGANGRRSLVDCSAASAIRLLSSHRDNDDGHDDKLCAPATAADRCDKAPENSNGGPTFRPTTNDTMLGMFV